VIHTIPAFLTILKPEFYFSDERMVDSMGLAVPKKSGLEVGLKLGSYQIILSLVV